MLNNRLLNMATDVAAVIPSNKKLVCKPGSPLEYIFNTITPDKETIMSTEDINQSLSNIVEKGNDTISYTNTKVITVLMADILDAYSEKFKAQFSFVKNVVNPIIKEISTGVEDNLKERIKRAEDLVIVKEAIPEILQTGYYNYISTFLSKLNVQKGPNYRPNFKNANLTEEQIRALVSKDEAFNEQILKLADEYKNIYNSDAFVDAYNLLVENNNEKLGNIDNKYRTFLLAIIAFTIVDRISTEPVQGLELGIEALTLWCAFARSSLARVIRVNIDLINSAITNGILVKYILGNTVTVYGDVFDNWDEADKQTILLGVSKSNSRIRLIKEINENRDKLLSLGRVAIDNIINANTDDKAGRIISSIVTHLIRLVDNTRQSEDYNDFKSFIDANIPTFEYRDKAIRYLNSNYPNDKIVNTNTHLLVADLVCELFFKETMASVIITKLAQTEIKHPEYNANELFTVSVIDLITEWVAGQIYLVDK